MADRKSAQLAMPIPTHTKTETPEGAVVNKTEYGPVPQPRRFASRSVSELHRQKVRPSKRSSKR